MQASGTLVIVGAGGHGRVVADAALRQGAWSRVVATDRDPDRCTGELLPGVALVPLEQALALDAQVHVAIGNAAARERECAAAAGRLATVTHPQASVSPFAEVGEGSFLAAQSVVAPSARVGRGVIVNHGAIVDHDCMVGDFCHIAPQAALGGAVRIGARVLLGTGTSVLPGVSVCDDVVAGAGAAVCGDVQEPGVYVGVPARRIR